MTAINNLKGFIVKDGSVIYSEELEPGLIFSVVEMYEPKYEQENYGHSSIVWREATITTGTRYTYSNGVHSLDEHQRQEYAPFLPLRELRTKDGYRVWEHAFMHHPLNGKDSRRVKWLVEIPKEKLRLL